MAPAPLLPHRARFLPGAAAWPEGRARLLHESFVHAQRRRPQRRVRADGGRPASDPTGRGGHVRLPDGRRPGRPTLPAAPEVPLSLRGAELRGHDPRVTDALLRTEQLSRSYGSLLAVDRVDLTVHAGELRSIIGPNGAGKTTLFRLISGEVAPTAGRIWFRGREVTGLPQHVVSRLGIAKSYQITNVFPRLTVRENVRVAAQGHARSFDFWSRADRLAAPLDRARALLATVGLERKADLLAAHRYYGEAHILQGVSMTVGEGEVVTLIGRNGAGKTTTLRSIMGVARPRRGRVVLRGEDVTGLGSHEISRRGIAWVPEERRVLPNLTVLAT